MIGLIKGTARQVKSVSGLPLPIASYNGNLKAPIKKLSLSINPTQSGSGDPAPDNVRPITGVSSVNVTRTGDVYYLTSAWTNQTVQANGGVVSATNRLLSENIVLPRGIYKVKCFDSSIDITIRVYNAKSRSSITYVSDESVSSWNSANDFSFTITDNYYVSIVARYNDSSDIGVNALNKVFYVVDSSADYGQTYLIQLGDTYYGGELYIDEDGNVKFRVTHKQGDLGDYSYTKYSNKLYYANPTDKKNNTDIMCDSLKFAGNFENATGANSMSNGQIGGFSNTESSNHWLYVCVTSDMTPTALKEYVTGMKVVFELATPIEIDLGNLSIPSLLGQNNIWHDGNGDVDELVYQNRQLYYGR